jgi:hypothetical protein
MKGFAAAAVMVLLQSGAGRVVERGDQSNIDAPRQVAVRTAAEWTALWRQHAPERQPPKIDFEQEMVIGLFLGSRPSAGFAIELVDTSHEQGTLVIRYRETSPPPDALSAQILTFAYTLVALPQHTGPVRFEKQN